MTNPRQRIDVVRGPALIVPGDDMDTDRIIPARFLKSITFDGLGDHVFADDRRQAAEQGAQHPFDDPERAGARILFVGSNFGCGSSREHAPRAIAQRGIGAIVGESFSEIFASNALMLGLPCVVVSPAGLERLRGVVADPARDVVVDLDARSVAAGAVVEAALIGDGTRAALLSGDWDATALLLDAYDDVEATKARLPYLNVF